MQAVRKYIYIYIYIFLQESFTTCYHGYELLKRFSDNFPGASTHCPFKVTNFKVAICHFTQAKVTGINKYTLKDIKRFPTTLLRNYSLKKYPLYYVYNDKDRITSSHYYLPVWMA